MKLIICSVYDKAVGAYMRPFFAQSPGQAVRMFVDEVNGDSPFNKHPEDYALFQIGEFFDNDGKIMAIEPHCLARGHEVKESDNA
jgi:hypothetical protein